MARYRKLVRDKIPKKIRRNGEEPKIRFLPVAELKIALLDKLVEEAQEARDARTHRELLSELADLYETGRATMRLMRISRKQLRQAVKARRAEHGGFKKGIFLEGVKRRKA